MRTEVLSIVGAIHESPDPDPGYRNIPDRRNLPGILIAVINLTSRRQYDDPAAGF